MFNIISALIGGISLLLVAVAFLPLLGIANWLILPLPIVGLLIGLLSRGRLGRNLNLAALIIGIVRLAIGGGVL
jgi:hypothetical protein